MKIKILIILSLLIIGCKNKNYYKEKIHHSFKIEISSNFKVIDYHNSFSTTGDYSENFGLQFTQKEFLKIFNLIQPKRDIEDSNVYYYEIMDNNIFTELTFKSKTSIIYYLRIEE